MRIGSQNTSEKNTKMQSYKPGISLCMIVRNELHNLPDFFKSWIDVVDEFCIMDTGSEDGTVSFIKELQESNNKIKLEQITWIDDFAYARNKSLTMASHQWVIWADADDRIDPESGAVIKDLGQKNIDMVFLFKVSSELWDGTISSIYQERMFPNGIAVFQRAVHESIKLLNSKTTLCRESSVVINHIGYQDKDKLELKRKRNWAIIEKHLDDPVLVYYWGQKWQVTGDWWRAISVFLWAFYMEGVQNKLRDQIAYSIGFCFLNINSFNVAIEWLKGAKVSDALFYLAECYRKSNDILEAKKHYELYLGQEDDLSLFGNQRSVLVPRAIMAMRQMAKSEVQFWDSVKPGDYA